MRPFTDKKHDPRLSIAMGRRYRRQSQEGLADALTEATGDRWSRGMVANLESGQKRLTVDALMVIAEIHQLPYSFYMEGPDSTMGGYLGSLQPAVA